MERRKFEPEMSPPLYRKKISKTAELEESE
jgi:hypothetical protein